MPKSQIDDIISRADRELHSQGGSSKEDLNGLRSSFAKKDKNVTRISQINQPVLSDKPGSQQKSYRSRDLSKSKVGTSNAGMSIP